MIAATLFSGIGAPETAMPSWQWPWHAEIERFPSAVMAVRHPASQNLGDVTADDFCEHARSIASPNVIVFGSPCQDFSVAGKRLGLDGARGNLALAALRIIARLEPRWFVFENVPGLLSSSEGRDFGIFLRTVDELGYSLAWTVLDAQYFGVAQRRKRVFAVGHSGDWRYPAAVLFEPEGLCGHYPPGREARQDVAGCIGASAARRRGSGINPNTLTAETFVTHALRADGFDASEDGTGRGTPLVAFSCKDHGADAMADLSPTLRAGTYDKSHANGGVPPAVTVALRGREGGGSAVRRLTPRECERLQGFSDDYTNIIYRGKPAADGPRYKALGNSMAVPVLRWILSRIGALEETNDVTVSAATNGHGRHAA